MITPYKHLSLLCLLILAAGIGVSCSAEPSIQAEATAIEKAEQKTPSTTENTVVASEDEVLTWDESVDQTKSASEKESPNK